MSERKALTLAFMLGMGLWALACTALMLLRASPELIVLAMLAALGGTGYATSSVIHHYGKERRGDRRP
jgi:hypothetical protein